MKVALVTGGGTGIGRAAALELNKIDYVVYVVGRREEELNKTSSLAENKNFKIIPVKTDITNGNEVIDLFNKIKNDHGRIDLLFNNAGMGAPRVPIEELKEEDWRKTVNNGSVSAHSPRPDTVAYTATKHAINGLTKSIALDGRNFNISCSQLDIGNADTAIGSRFKTGVPQANGDVMVEPVFEAIDCGKAVAYIASLPEGTNILNMTIMATNMPFVGRG